MGVIPQAVDNAYLEIFEEQWNWFPVHEVYHTREEIGLACDLSREGTIRNQNRTC